MTNREEFVAVKVKGGGAISFSAGQKYSLRLAGGEIAEKWADGEPITRAEFEEILAPHGPFEIAQLAAAAEPAEISAPQKEEE